MTKEIRQRRQRANIERAAVAGDLARASALLAEHVIEFPEDSYLLLHTSAGAPGEGVAADDAALDPTGRCSSCD